MWTPNGNETHSAPCKRTGCNAVGTTDCNTYEVTVDGVTSTICPVCGDKSGSVMNIIDGAVIDGPSLPIGEMVVRGVEAPVEGALYGFTAIYEHSGKIEAFSAPVKVTLPIELSDSFKLVRVDTISATDSTESAEAWTDVPFTFEDGILNFDTETSALYLLIAE